MNDICILKFSISISDIDQNLIELANTIRTLLYQEDPSLFDLIDIEDENVFLEPSIFNYFTRKNLGETAPLMQVLWGYIPNELKPKILVFSDNSGIINLPNIGCFQYLPNQSLQVSWDLRLVLNNKSCPDQPAYQCHKSNYSYSQFC